MVQMLLSNFLLRANKSWTTSPKEIKLFSPGIGTRRTNQKETKSMKTTRIYEKNKKIHKTGT